MSDSEINGHGGEDPQAGPADGVRLAGGAGGAFIDLKRSEMNAMARLANRYPTDSSERREIVETVLNIARHAKSTRHRLTAAKVFGQLDRMSLDELKIYIDLKRELASEGHAEQTGGAQFNVQIIEQVVTKADMQAMPAVVEEVVHKPGTNGHANGKH